MLEVIYYRTKARVEDLRYFKDLAEFDEWFLRQMKLEPIIVIKKTELKKES